MCNKKNPFHLVDYCAVYSLWSFLFASSSNYAAPRLIYWLLHNFLLHNQIFHFGNFMHLFDIIVLLRKTTAFSHYMNPYSSFVYLTFLMCQIRFFFMHCGSCLLAPYFIREESLMGQISVGAPCWYAFCFGHLKDLSSISPSIYPRFRLKLVLDSWDFPTKFRATL